MIKNLNDLLSFIVLILMTVFSLRFFVWSLFGSDDNAEKDINKWQLLKDYIDNTEE